jgi:hypothetical protein
LKNNNSNVQGDDIWCREDEIKLYTWRQLRFVVTKVYRWVCITHLITTDKFIIKWSFMYIYSSWKQTQSQFYFGSWRNNLNQEIKLYTWRQLLNLLEDPDFRSLKNVLLSWQHTVCWIWQQILVFFLNICCITCFSCYFIFFKLYMKGDLFACL